MTESRPPSGGDDPWALPEGFEFDEAFIRGGRHEPPARTRESIARYGGQRTSWRHGGLVEPGPGGRAPVGQARRRRPWGLIACGVVVVGLIVAALLASRGSTGGGAPAPVARATISPVSSVVGSPSSAPAQVHGASPSDRPGTCYSAPGSGTSSTRLDLSVVACTSVHDFELVSHEAASGQDATYPAISYWDGPVERTCLADLESYLGHPGAGLPAGVSSEQFHPTPVGWAQGDRNVYCLARLQPRRSGSVKP